MAIGRNTTEPNRHNTHVDMGSDRRVHGGGREVSRWRPKAGPGAEERKRGEAPTGIVLSEIHVDGGGDDTIIPGIAPIAPEIRRPAADVIDHATEEVNLPPFVRGSGTAVGRRCRGSGSSTAGDLIGPHGAVARIRIMRHPLNPDVSGSTCSKS